MFTRSCVPVRIADVRPELMEKDDAEIALVVLSCEINPLTAELAQEIHDFVRATQGEIIDAEVDEDALDDVADEATSH